MTAQGGDLLAWLETTISEREAKARKATSGVCPDWVYSAVRHVARNCQIECSHDDHQGWNQPEWDRYDDSPHIILNSPEDALRRCAAARKELARHTPTEWPTQAPAACPSCAHWNHDVAMGDSAASPVPFPCPSVLSLAEGYGWAEGER